MQRNFIQTLHVGFKSWKVSVFVLFLIVLGGASLFIHRMPYVYSTDMRILPTGSDFASQSNPSTLAPTPAQFSVLTKLDRDREAQIYKILYSRSMIEAVLTASGDKPTDAMITKFAKYYSILKDTKSNVITIRVRNSNPKTSETYCKEVLNYLNNQIAKEDTGDAVEKLNLYQTHLLQNQKDLMDVENALKQVGSTDAKKLFNSNDFIKNNFVEADFSTYSASTIKNILNVKIASLNQISSYLSQQHEIIQLEMKQLAKKNSTFFQLVDAPKLTTIPDAPDKTSLFFMALVLSIFVPIAYIYARLYILDALSID